MSDERENMDTMVYTHDSKGQRTDIHRPSAINPGDYEYLRVGEARKERKAGQVLGGPGGTCHHCGKAIVWEVYFRHIPSGNVMTFGYICAGILEMTDNRIDHEMTLLKRRAANERKAAKWETTKQDRFDTFVAQYPEIYQFVQDHADENGWLNRIKWGIEKYGSPLEYDIPKLQRFIEGHKKYIANQLKQAAEQVNMPELQDGRQNLTGTILSTRMTNSNFGDVRKMRVKLDDGNVVYGTVPKALYAALSVEDMVGAKVSFMGTVKVKEDHFGYFSFPKNITVK